MESPRQATENRPTSARTVAVVIPCYNQARFLDDALRSVMTQTRPADEVIVVDDGSDDDPGSVTTRYPGVHLIRQENAGLSGARNAGLAACTADKVAFLDADDVLEPGAIAANLTVFGRNPDAGFIYGAYVMVDGDLRQTSGPHFRPVKTNAALEMLVGNPVGMHATVLYDRQRLLEAGGFDASLRVAEDYDAYIRMARRHPVACHSGIVAAYRIHDANMSRDPMAMLGGVLAVLDRCKPSRKDRAGRATWREARRFWKDHYAAMTINTRDRHRGLDRQRQVLNALRHAPASTLARLGHAIKRRAARKFGPLTRRQGNRAPLGGVNMGAFATTDPVSRFFGYDRGTPIDRHYIEGFLARHGEDIRGRVLEVGDDSYSRRFGSAITKQDVLHISPDAPGATIVGDLSTENLLPREAFDCLIVTQTLHLVFDMVAAARQLHDSLRPGGVLLLTAPYITPIDPLEWNADWFWAISGQGARRLFGEVFGADNVTVATHGNAHVATCFVQGLAREEIDPKLLDIVDPSYPVIVTVRATRMG